MFSPVCLAGIVPPNVHCACIHVGHIICPVYWKWDIRSRLGVYILLNHFIYCKIKTPENEFRDIRNRGVKVSAAGWLIF